MAVDDGDDPRRNCFLRLNIRVSFLLSIITTRRANANDGENEVTNTVEGDDGRNNV